MRFYSRFIVTKFQNRSSCTVSINHTVPVVDIDYTGKRFRTDNQTAFGNTRFDKSVSLNHSFNPARTAEQYIISHAKIVFDFQQIFDPGSNAWYGIGLNRPEMSIAEIVCKNGIIHSREIDV